MRLRLFIDQCVPAEVSPILREAGHEVVLLRDASPIRAPDVVVIGEAQKRGAILISLDGDFSDIVAYPPSNYCGIITLQLHNHPEVIPELMLRLLEFLHGDRDQEYFRGKTSRC